MIRDCTTDTRNSVCGFRGQLVYQTPAAKARSQTVDLSLFTDAQPGEVAEAILCPPHKVKPQNKLPAVSVRANPVNNKARCVMTAIITPEHGDVKSSGRDAGTAMRGAAPHLNTERWEKVTAAPQSDPELARSRGSYQHRGRTCSCC